MYIIPAMQASFERDISFFSGPGLRLLGTLELPPGYREGELRPAVALCRGPGGAREFLTPEVSHYLAGAGYACLRFGYRGFWGSDGAERRMVPREQVEDISNALTFLEQQQEVSPARLGIWGATIGASHAISAAGADSRVKCVVSVSGIGDFARWFRSMRRYWEWIEFLKRLDEDRRERVLAGKSRIVDTSEIIVPSPVQERLTPLARQKHRDFGAVGLPLESAEAMLEYRPEDSAASISPRAALWVCAGDDTFVPNEESERMYETAGEPKKLAVLPGFEHPDLYFGEGFGPSMALAREWFGRYL